VPCLVSWDGLWLGVFPQELVRYANSAWPLLVTAALAAATAQLAALVAAVRSGTGRARPSNRTAATVSIAAGVVLFVGGLLAALAGGTTLAAAYDLSMTNFAWARWIAAVCCAVAVPLGVLATRSARTAALLLLGWLLAALTSAGNDIVGGYAAKSAVALVIGLAAGTTLLGYVCLAVLRRLRTRPDAVRR
jgi:hypothetical protein